MIGTKRARLSVVGLGVALGVMCGVWMFLIGFLALNYDTPFAKDLILRWKEIYPGIDVTWAGASVAAAWGFLKGFVTGIIFGWLYNLCLCCCTSCCSCCKCSCNQASCSSCHPNKPIV